MNPYISQRQIRCELNVCPTIVCRILHAIHIHLRSCLYRPDPPRSCLHWPVSWIMLMPAHMRLSSLIIRKVLNEKIF